jgi:hypothetical protein
MGVYDPAFSRGFDVLSEQTDEQAFERLVKASSGPNIAELFATKLYTGNGSTQTINNGINLAAGGRVWLKSRSSASDHALFDTARGGFYPLKSNTTDAQAFENPPLTFGTSGFSLTSLGNGNTQSYVAWSFKDAPRFTSTHLVSHTNGTATNIDLSALGTVGMVVAKTTMGTGFWWVYHRALAVGHTILRNSTDPAGASSFSMTVTGTTVTLPAAFASDTYIIEAYAHDTASDGAIQCGSYVGNGSTTGPVIDLGWEPQFILAKNATGTGNWWMLDTARVSGSNEAVLFPNLTNAESSLDVVSWLSTGFQPVISQAAYNGASQTYIYMAIRKP